MTFGKSGQLTFNDNQLVPHQHPLPKWERVIRFVRKSYLVWFLLSLLLPGSLIFLHRSGVTVSPIDFLLLITKYGWLFAVVALSTVINFGIRWLRWHFLARQWNAHYMAQLIKEASA